MKLSLQQLTDRTGISGRTIRYYIQRGLLPGPQGEKRGAWYGEGHLADLLRIQQWQSAGLSLEAIADLLMARREAPLSPARPGAIEVRSHLIVADGIEVVVAPDRAGLTQAQLRQLFLAVQAAYTGLVEPTVADEPPQGDPP
jgi:DNA-binding transcriptional MerR regulator